MAIPRQDVTPEVQERFAALLEESAAKVRQRAPREFNIDTTNHLAEVPDGMFVRREPTGGRTVRVEIVWG